MNELERLRAAVARELPGVLDDLAALVEEAPTDVWARFALGRVLERQSRYADALPHMRLAAVMSGDPEHEAGVLRVERRIAESGGSSYDDLR